MNKTSVTVGLFGVRLDTYWPQFKGMRERLLGYQRDIARRISSQGVKLVDAGGGRGHYVGGVALHTQGGPSQDAGSPEGPRPLAEEVNACLINHAPSDKGTEYCQVNS